MEIISPFPHQGIGKWGSVEPGEPPIFPSTETSVFFNKHISRFMSFFFLSASQDLRDAITLAVQFPCFSAVLEATHEASLGALWPCQLKKPSKRVKDQDKGVDGKNGRE